MGRGFLGYRDDRGPDSFHSFLSASVGVFKNGRVEIIANDQGNRITPSYVAFTPEGERLIGDAAKNQLTSNPENTVFDAKRLIGRTWNDPSVQQDIKFLPFKVRSGFFTGKMVVVGIFKIEKLLKNTIRSAKKGYRHGICNFI